MYNNSTKTNKAVLGRSTFFASIGKEKWAGIAQLVQRLAISCTVRRSNPGGAEIFRTRRDRPWDPSNSLYNGYGVSFPGVEQRGRGVNHPPRFNAEAEERVELYLHSPSRPSCPVLGQTLPLS
jgi:hypothetical protein